ncbi:MAG: hypothetical protein WBM32_14055, partial [Crocosphaera sp.]
ARQCQVDHKTVGKIRQRLTGDFPSNKTSQSLTGEIPSDDNPRTYTTKHGTVATMNTSNIGKAPKLKGKTEATTSMEQELKEQGKRLGLSYNKHTDQVLPDVERHHATTSEVDDRPGASVAIVKMDERTKQAVRAFLDNVETISDTQLKVLGATLARRCPGKAEVLASTIAGMGEELAEAVVKSAVLVYPEAVATALGTGKVR